MRLLKCSSFRSGNSDVVLLQAKIAKALLDQRNQIHVEEKARQHELDLERVRGQNQLQMALALSAKASKLPSSRALHKLCKSMRMPKLLTELAGGVCRTPQAA